MSADAGRGLEPFNEAARCPKCGHDDISTTYRRSGYDCMLPRICGQTQWAGEHHDRSCRRCGFGWAEAALGATGAGEPGGRAE